MLVADEGRAEQQGMIPTGTSSVLSRIGLSRKAGMGRRAVLAVGRDQMYEKGGATESIRWLIHNMNHMTKRDLIDEWWMAVANVQESNPMSGDKKTCLLPTT